MDDSTCSLVLFSPLFFPFLHVVFFSPFLVLCFYRCSLSSCLWWALICGFIIDLFSYETRLGIYAINYCLTTFCLYRYKFHFFEDRLSTLPVMTFGFTNLSFLIQIGLFFITGKAFSLSLEWVINDLLLIPLQTATYAVLAFIFPFSLLSLLKRRYFLFRLKRGISRRERYE